MKRLVVVLGVLVGFLAGCATCEVAPINTPLPLGIICPEEYVAKVGDEFSIPYSSYTVTLRSFDETEALFVMFDEEGDKFQQVVERGMENVPVGVGSHYAYIPAVGEFICLVPAGGEP